MEDSIGTIFYIVLTVIVLIITFINRKKRQKEAASIPPKEEKDAFDPFELFEEDSMEPATEASDQRIPPEPRAPSVRSKLGSLIDEGVSAFSEEPSREERFKNRTSREMIKDDKEEQPPRETNEFFVVYQEESELDKIMKEFDLKKAIIHSEIINRKEF